MIGTSALFSQKIAESSRQFRARLLYDGAAISGEIRNITINKGACGESFSIGSIYSSYIEVTLDRCEELLENKELLLQIGLVIDDTVEYIDMGYYTVSKPKTSAYSTTFTAVGRISAKLNIILTLPEELTLSNLAAAITEATGIQIICKGVTLAGTIEEPLTGLTCREILEVITAVLGGFATEDNNGNIVISKFSTADPVSFNGDRTTTDPEFNDYDYEITGVKVIVTEEWTDEDGTVHPEVSFTDGELRQIISLKYMTESLFPAFKNNIVGYTYRPGTVPLALGDPRLEPWDCIKFTDANEQTYTVPCLNIVHTFDGGLATTITAPGESESGTAAEIKGSLAQQLKGLEVTLLSIQEAIVKRLKADEILTEDIKFATGEFTKYLKGVRILAEQIDVDGLFAKDIEATGSVKGLTFISEGTPNYEDLPPEFGAWLGLSKLKADTASLIITSGTEGETDYLEAVSTAFGTKYRVYLTEGSYGGIEESVLYVDGFGINFMTRQYDESEFESLFKVDFNGVSWKGSQLITRAELEKILNDLTGGGSIVLEETDPTVPAWAKAPTKPTYTASEVGARPNNWMPTASDVGARPNTWTPSASDVGADPKGTAEEKVSGHNTNTEAHNDIRLLIEGLNTRLNALADSDDTTLDQMSELVAYIKSNRELIEGVTTDKVNVTDIIDNLTTNVANKPLSAAQGVALKGLIDALQTAVNKIKVPTKVSELENDSEFLNAVPDEYVTEEELEAKGYAQQKTLEKHTSDTVAHITADERTSWNSKADGKHTHVWNDITDRPFGDLPTEEGTDTITSDDVVYGKLHRVSEFIPTYEDLQQGGSLTYYTVTDGAITGELKTITFPQGDYTIGSSNNGLMIRSDGIPMVVISFNGDPEFGAITFPDITEPGVYFDQGSYGKCIHSLTINGYDGFKLYETRTLPKKYLPDDIGGVKTVNYIAPDENGNINVEGGGGSSEAFDLVKSGTLTWNGDTEGKVVVYSDAVPDMPYVKVSDATPTLAELQEGFTVTWDSGMSYECEASSVTENGNYIVVDNTTGFVIKEENTTFTEDGVTYVFPKTGTYFLNYLEEGNEDFVSEITINNYTGFTKPVLKMRSLTQHGHDWYGKVIKEGNTVRGDDIIHGGFVKVSDAVPTLAEVQKGGTLRFYYVDDNKISGDLIVANYLESPYSIVSPSGEIWIASDGIVMVQIKSDGTYFRQSEDSCVHSLTINEYTGFTHNLEKIPAELLPEGISSGASDCDWNIMKNRPFGETTTVTESEILTWDGDMSNAVDVSGGQGFYMIKLSDVTPTLEDLSKGGSATNTLGTFNFTSYADSGMGMYFAVGDDAAIEAMGEDDIIFGFPIIVPEGVDMSADGGPVLTKGTYAYYIEGGLEVTSFTINDYIFVETETIVDTIELKYLPESHQFGETTETVMGDTLTWDGDMTGKPVVTLDMGEDGVMNFCKVSEAVPTLEDMSNGVSATIPGMGSQELTADMVTVGDGYIFAGVAAIISESNTLVEEIGLTFPETGIWLASQSGMYISEAKINGYTGFETTGTTIKHIDTKYLDILENELTDTIYVADVSDEIRHNVGYYNTVNLVRITDIVNAEIFQNSYAITDRLDGTRLICAPSDYISGVFGIETIHGWTTGFDGVFDVLVVLEDTTTDVGTLKKGIYVLNAVKSLTIKDRKIFPKSALKSGLLSTGIQDVEGIMLTGEDAPGGDTLYSLGVNDVMPLLVSTVKVTLEDLQQGVTVSACINESDGYQIFEFPTAENTIVEKSDGSIFLYANNDTTYYLARFTDTGVYFACRAGIITGQTYGRVEYMTIKGFTGFPIEGKKVVNPEYLPDVTVEKLPESHQFGSTLPTFYGSAKVENGSIVWDGDTTGLFQINGMSCYLLTDDTRLFDFDGQITLTRFSPEGSATAFVDMSSGNVKFFNTYIDGLGILVASEDNALIEGWGITLIIPKKGTYAANNIQMRIAAEGIDFGSEAIKTIDPKYLPSGFGGSTADTDEIVQEVLAALPTWEGGSY